MAIMVVMALVTTFLTAPLAGWIYPLKWVIPVFHKCRGCFMGCFDTLQYKLYYLMRFLLSEHRWPVLTKLQSEWSRRGRNFSISWWICSRAFRSLGTIHKNMGEGLSKSLCIFTVLREYHRRCYLCPEPISSYMRQMKAHGAGHTDRFWCHSWWQQCRRYHEMPQMNLVLIMLSK